MTDTTVQHVQVTVPELGFEGGTVLCDNMYEAFVVSNNAADEFGIAPEKVQIEMVWLH